MSLFQLRGFRDEEDGGEVLAGPSLERLRRWSVRHSWWNEEAEGVVSFADIFNNTEAETARRLCVCQLCGCKVGVTRFAMHLETCSRRGLRRKKRAVEESESLARQQAAAKSSRKRALQKRTRRPDPNLFQLASASSSSPSSSHVSLSASTDTVNHCASTENETNVVERQNHQEQNEIPRCYACKQSLSSGERWMCYGCDRLFHTSCKTSALFCFECSPLVELQPNEVEKIPDQVRRNASPCDRLEYFCNVCGDLIHNVRYRCLECPNFDSCRRCHELRQSQVTQRESAHALALAAKRNAIGFSISHSRDHHMVRISVTDLYT